MQLVKSNIVLTQAISLKALICTLQILVQMLVQMLELVQVALTHCQTLIQLQQHQLTDKY